MTSPEPARLVSFDSTPLHVPTCTFGRHKSYRNGEFNSYIIACINTLEKAEFTTSIHLIIDFQNQEYRFTTSKFQKRWAGELSIICMKDPLELFTMTMHPLLKILANWTALHPSRLDDAFVSY